MRHQAKLKLGIYPLPPIEAQRIWCRFSRPTRPRLYWILAPEPVLLWPRSRRSPLIVATESNSMHFARTRRKLGWRRLFMEACSTAMPRSSPFPSCI